MSDCNAQSTLTNVNQRLSRDDGSPMSDGKSYQELLEGLMYPSVSTRPNTSFTLSGLTQYSKNPKTLHLNALKEERRYLKGTEDFQVEYSNPNQMKELNCNTDASWYSTADAKSFSGILFCRNGGLGHWRSKM
ncbi:PREDICTED: uncharacterized protein LOC108553995 [Eufriesea mexicana]|uniref:uncharacterized protein LOC108553995 n=1 Tax=Eufriesea mexicana TaxID=516756 RepID=UPI00083C39A9|nr:PREDICTED: uncharacterized protein LOC108553995 [Eufriesea mexicana]